MQKIPLHIGYCRKTHIFFLTLNGRTQKYKVYKKCSVFAHGVFCTFIYYRLRCLPSTAPPSPPSTPSWRPPETSRPQSSYKYLWVVRNCRLNHNTNAKLTKKYYKAGPRYSLHWYPNGKMGKKPLIIKVKLIKMKHKTMAMAFRKDTKFDMIRFKL